MVYDCFMFFNELELLEIRLHELSGVVDRFVLAESTLTHSRQPKPLYFQENADKFRAFADKIHHIVVDDFPADYKDAWTYENHQRDQVKQALTHCRPDDAILISDVDEIPKAETLIKVLETPGIKILEQKMFYYYLNMFNYKNPWWRRGTRVIRWEDFTNSATEIRLGPGTLVPDGGWHFSYLGGAEKVRQKIEAFAHQEFNRDEFKNADKIGKIIQSGGDIFDRKKMRFRVEALDETYPEYILQNREKFRHLIKDPKEDGWLTRAKRFFHLPF